MSYSPFEFQSGLDSPITLSGKEARTIQHMKESILFKTLRRFGKQAMDDSERTISILSKTLDMSKPFHNTRADTLFKSTQCETAHLASGLVPGI